VEHPTDGNEPEVPESAERTQSTQPISPVPAQPTGLDYTISTPAPPPEPVRWKRSSPFPNAIIAFLAAMAGSLATVGILAVAGFFDTADTGIVAAPTTTAVSTTLTTPTVTGSQTGFDPRVVEAVWQKVNPSIVTVEVGPEPAAGEDFVPDASGSGVAIGNGHVVTNHHVIEGEDRVQIVLQDGKIYDADVVGSDPLTDLAVLSTSATELVPIDLGSTTGLAIGEPTIAVGNPLGQRGGASLTVGVLSALSRRVDFDDGSTLWGMLQTDAPITNGSSGGALVDEHGALIGITAAIGISEAGAEGIGYAIPIELVRRITDEIIEVGAAHHAFLGIVGGDYVETAPDGARIPAGAEIEEIEPGYSAERAGIEAGDVIVSMGGQPIATMDDLVIELRLFRVGDEIYIEYQRDGEEHEVRVTLDERPEGV
jgi:putative serine protease PepD